MSYEENDIIQKEVHSS